MIKKIIFILICILMIVQNSYAITVEEVRRNKGMVVEVLVKEGVGIVGRLEGIIHYNGLEDSESGCFIKIRQNNGNVLIYDIDDIHALIYGIEN